MSLLPNLALAIDTEPEVQNPSFTDQQFLKRNREFVNDVLYENYGAIQLRGDKSDLQLIKRILRDRLFTQKERSKFISLGIALGDIYVSELGLEWKSYVDEEDRSQVSFAMARGTLAVCAKNTTYCLFPATMISKRGVLGVVPDVEKIYHRGVGYIWDHLPKVPYSVDKNQLMKPN